MGKKIIGLVLICVMALSLVLASCGTKSTTSSTTPATTSTTVKTSTTTSTTTTTTTTNVTTTTSGSGNWWDKLGTPQYGGTMTLQGPSNYTYFDPIRGTSGPSFTSAYMEQLFADDWKLDPAIFDFGINFHANEYQEGWLAKSWEFTDPNTYVAHLRQGIHWQNIAPANGREFVASDVAYHYNRLFGLGDGFTTPSPYWSTITAWKDLISVTATDKYTVAFKWKSSNPEAIVELMMEPNSAIVGNMDCPDVVKQYGNLDDWQHAVGTGPFILQDFVSGSSATFVRNPNYWGYDERYPKNQLPYVDTLKLLIIPDTSTALAGLRAGKIDAVGNLTLQVYQQMQKTNPEILTVSTPATTAVAIEPRNDTPPFNDIRVRQALQMALDLPTIANTYYGGTCSPLPSSLCSRYEKGWGFPYEQWPQDLKDQYAFNPTAAKKLLADAGFPTGFSTTIYADAGGDLDILQIVKAYWSSIGVNADIKPMDSASFSTFVRSAQNTTMGVRRLSGLGRVISPMSWLAVFNFGGNDNIAKVHDPVYDAYYPAALASTSIDDIKKIVSDADRHVAENHYGISLLTPQAFNLYQAWFKGYHGQDSTIQEYSSGYTHLSFYSARFWIDQNLKQSMGK